MQLILRTYLVVLDKLEMTNSGAEIYSQCAEDSSHKTEPQIQIECGAYERESNECVDKEKLIIFDSLEVSGRSQARGHHEFQNRLLHTLLLRAAP